MLLIFLGLDRWVKVDKKNFIGADAVKAEKAAGGPKRITVQMKIDSNVIIYFSFFEEI